MAVGDRLLTHAMTTLNPVAAGEKLDRPISAHSLTL